MHEKFCLVAKTHPNQDQVEKSSPPKEAEKGKRKPDSGQKVKKITPSDFNSTRGSSQLDPGSDDINVDEDK